MGPVLKYKNIIVVIIIILAFSIAAKKIHSNYLSREEKLSAGMKDINMIKKIKDKLRDTVSRLSNLKAKIFNGSIFDFKGVLEQGIRNYNVTIQSFKPRTMKETEEYKKIKIDVNIAADYKGLTKFVSTIESVPSAAIISLNKRNNNIYNISFEVILK